MSSRTGRGSVFQAAAILAGSLFAANSFAAIVSVGAVSLDSQSQTDVPMTFGEIFKQGDVPAGANLTATIDGQPIPIQVDKKATNSDGSLRHAVVTVLIPSLGASAHKTVDLSTGAASPAGTPVTLDDVLATTFDAEVSLNVGGTIYTASARQLLQEASGSCHPWGQQCNVWLSGPQVSEWIVGGPVKTAGGSESPHLGVYFYVRAYRGDPINRIRVNAVIENDWAYDPAPQNLTYDATIKVGSNTYSKANIDHYVHARWHKVMWWGNKAAVYAKVDTRYLQASKAISQYADVKPTDAFLDTVIQSVGPMGNGDNTPHMGNTGAQPTIGPLPRWTTAYVLDGDRRAFEWMLANDDGAGSYGIYYRDKNTGRPISLRDYESLTILGHYGDSYDRKRGAYDNFADCAGDCSSPLVPDTAHEPSIGYVSYIVTGDFYYLGQLQFWANYNEIEQNPGSYSTHTYRDHATGLLQSCQVRCQAWALRTLADAAYITPDDDAFKSYFTQMVQNNLAWYNDTYTNNPDANKLGAIIHGGHAIVYDDHTRLAPWQDDFVTWAVGHVADLGFAGAEQFLQWKSKFVVDRMANPDFCWILAAAYNLQVRDTSSSPLYTSIAQVYSSQFPALQDLGCDNRQMLDALTANRYDAMSPGKVMQLGEMTGYPYSPTGFPANMQPALAAAVDSGIPNAAVAWETYGSRSIEPDYSDYANWAVVPRHDMAVPAPRIDIYAEPNPVKPGASTQVHWNASNSDSCSAGWLDTSAASGEQTVGPISGSKDYTITCSGTGGTSRVTLTVKDTNSIAKPIIDLTAAPVQILAGQSTTLSWQSTHADNCAASGGWSGNVPVSGDQVVGPLKADTSFAINCSGTGGKLTKTVMVHVESIGDPSGSSTTAGDSSSNGASGPAADVGTADSDPQTTGSTHQGGAGAFGLFGYAWLLGLAILARRWSRYRD